MNPHQAQDSPTVAVELRHRAVFGTPTDEGVPVDTGLLNRAAFLLELHAPAPPRVYESPEREASSKAMASLLKAAACMYNIDRGDIGRRIGNLVDEIQAEFYAEQVPEAIAKFAERLGS